RLLGRTLAGMPAFVDSVWVVDDASDDGTWHAAAREDEPRVRRLRHAHNRGVGAAIVSGYVRALLDRADVIAVMAGDAQMDPRDLERVVTPVALGHADYVKGDRFRHPQVRRMPL